MEHIRKAQPEDLARIAEMEVFNYRLNFYPIFQSDWFYFQELTVPRQMEAYRPVLSQIWVWDDGAVKGFLQADQGELKKLFVEPVLHGHSIGGELLDFAVSELDVQFLWALEKNTRAIRFYQRHGFRVTADKKPETGTNEYLIRLVR